MLKADAGERRCGWTDTAIAEALDTSAATVHRVRQAFVTQGLEAAVARQRPTGRQYRKLDGHQEAQLIAVTCQCSSGRPAAVDAHLIGGQAGGTGSR